MSPLLAPPIVPFGQLVGQKSGYYQWSSTQVATALAGNQILRGYAMWSPVPWALDRIGLEVTAAGDAGSTVRLGIYADDGNFAPGAVLLDAGAIRGDSVAIQELLVPPTPNLLVPNLASFETSIVGWAAGGNTTLARSTAQALDGAASLAVTNVAGGASSYAASSVGVPVLPLTAYTLVASARASVASRTFQFNYWWLDAQGGLITTAPGGFTNTATNTAWTAGKWTATSPANAASVRVVVEFDSAGGVGEVSYVDQVGLFAGTQPVNSWSLQGSGLMPPGIIWLSTLCLGAPATEPTVRTVATTNHNAVYAASKAASPSSLTAFFTGSVAGPALPNPFTPGFFGSGVMPRVFVRRA